MRYVYYDSIAKRVQILPEHDTEQGLFVGSISDEDFGKLNSRFLVQSLLKNHGIDVTGLDIEIVIGPSPASQS